MENDRDSQGKPEGTLSKVNWGDCEVRRPTSLTTDTKKRLDCESK
jgi:hypothetical protein